MWKLIMLLLASPAFAERTYLQNLLDSDLSGPELYAVYDEHYDALSQEDKMKEKGAYPREVYEELLKHRSGRQMGERRP